MDVKGCEAQLSIFMEIALYVSIIIIITIIIIIIIIIIISISSQEKDCALKIWRSACFDKAQLQCFLFM